MPGKALREKAVKTACDAVRKYDSYLERAKYVRDKFDEDELGHWGCFTVHDGAKAGVYFTFFSKNLVTLKVGTVNLLCGNRIQIRTLNSGSYK